jgi:GAF domain-containing protein
MAVSPLGESLATLASFFVGDTTLEETLQRVSELTVQAVPAADFIGITMVVEGKNRTAVFTDDIAVEVDQAQYDSGEGPCLDAFEKQRIFRIESTLEDGPWPAFRRVAAEHGIHSTLSLPLGREGHAVGAMNLYCKEERAFTAADDEIGKLFAAQASIALANAQAYWDARELGSRLGDAMKSRAVIEQAKGMLMVTQPCDEDAAFDLLVRASQRENVKLRDIAKRIIDAAARRREERGAEAGPEL